MEENLIVSLCEYTSFSD